MDFSFKCFVSAHNEHDSPRCSIPPQGPFSRICFLVFLALHTTNTILCGFYTCHWGRPPQGPLSRFFFLQCFCLCTQRTRFSAVFYTCHWGRPPQGPLSRIFFSVFGSAHNEHNSLRCSILAIGVGPGPAGATLADFFLQCFWLCTQRTQFSVVFILAIGVGPRRGHSRGFFLVFLALHTTNTILCGFYTWPLSQIFLKVFLALHTTNTILRGVLYLPLG